MKADYISFEIAKLLKERGFNESVWQVFYEELPSSLRTAFTKNKKKVIDFFYSTKDTEVPSLFSNNNEIPKYIDTNVYAAPTLQIAMKWLREVHKLFIEIDYELYSNVNQEDENEKYQYGIAIKFIKQKEFEEVKRLVLNTLYNTYEEAAMDAIKYCLTKLL